MRRVPLNQFLAGRRRQWTGEEPSERLPEGRTDDHDADLRLSVVQAVAARPRGNGP